MTVENKNRTGILGIAAVVGVILLAVYVAFASGWIKAGLGNRAGGMLSDSVNTGNPALEGIIAARQSWDPQFTSWYGRAVEDFTVEGLDGKELKLSDYAGKSVIVVLWATWCPGCVAEIPHLIDLRKTYPADKLEIIAISNESAGTLKSFAESRSINYTVATLSGRLPKPFRDADSIPSSFFISAEGKLKVSAVGVVPVADAVKIIEL
jgi:thiol-disulfide isomerase/thioredoxin